MREFLAAMYPVKSNLSTAFLDRGKVFLNLALLTAFGGLFAAAVLSLGHVLDIPVPCGGSRGCGAVAAHPASMVWGIPIAHFGVATYVLVIVLIMGAVTRRWGRLALLSMTAVGAIASIALLTYSKMVIQAICPWCVASGMAMTALFVLSILIVTRARHLAPPPQFVLWLLALVTAGSLGAYAGKMQKDARAAPVSAELLSGLSPAELVDPLKSIGPDEAIITIIVFADLHCPACITAHASLVDYQSANPAAVRLVFRHLPLWNHSTVSAVLSEIAAERDCFWEFAEQVHARRGRLTGEQYLKFLKSLGCDPDEVERRVADDDDPAIARLNRDVALADRLGITSTPTFVVLTEGQPSRSFNLKTLPRLLNSSETISQLARVAKAE